MSSCTWLSRASLLRNELYGTSLKLQKSNSRSCSRNGQNCKVNASAHHPTHGGREDRAEPVASQKVRNFVVCAAGAMAVALSVPLQPPPAWAVAGSSVEVVRGPVYSEVAGLIAGPPVKDARALLRYALPINNKPIKEVQSALELITEDLKLPGTKAVDSAERSVRKASRALSQNKAAILADVADGKKDEGKELLDKLEDGLQSFTTIFEDKDRDALAPKQAELLDYVTHIEEDMVEKFPFEIPAEFADRPVLKGRATVEMKVRVKDNPNLTAPVVFKVVVDGYNAPVTAGNFVDLVQRHFYDGMEIQRADGFVVQTGDPDGPDGPLEGFVDPATKQMRTVPLEIRVVGDKEPIYGATLEEIGRFREGTALPFNAFGTMALAREEFSNDSGSSQVFWLLKESELTPTGANILDGRYAVFGYVTENETLLADLKVGDVLESVRVVQGLENLQTPSSTAASPSIV
ncbi:hypothetical protein CBR_g37206 [Chara braunii]|uniref:peptidylprolyl isomerase n=1 Tax=Chara braunii TaxID=69332 RepID=A0A388LMN8_CHABU|nr:hypothetical protein CBR_g37206 [Chara braunii]|eukprot:GBG83493.1 hypothetical protein CBR_g37206 [Chara braunii]